MNVVAVIVTYNRRQLLEAAVCSVLTQSAPVERLVVVDNGSSDGTAEYLATLDERVVTVTSRRNTGGAGGFARGMAWALHLGAEAIWLMDDDAVTEGDCLATLLEAWTAAADAPYLVPAVVDESGNPGTENRPFLSTDATEVFYALPHRQAPCVSASFVGPLIRASAARATHAPLEDYFLWHDDTEYLARLACARPGRFVPAARICHRATTQGPGRFVPDRAVRNIRNLVWCVRESGGSAIGWRAWLDLLRTILIAQLRDAPLRASTAAARGIVEGVLRRPRHRMLDEVWRESDRYHEQCGNSSGLTSD